MSTVEGGRLLLVGECNPHGADPKFALYPLPRGCAGSRLAAHLGMSRSAYLRAFDRVNLCVGRWNLDVARRRALELADERCAMVLLGARVCAAFGVAFEPFGCRFGAPAFVVLPHPSGRCRLWNAPEAPARARDAVVAMRSYAERSR